MVRESRTFHNSPVHSVVLSTFEEDQRHLFLERIVPRIAGILSISICMEM